MSEILNQLQVDYVKPELLCLVPVLCFIGKIFKDSNKIENYLIPFYLGVFAVILSSLWVFSTTPAYDIRSILSALFVSIVQGLTLASVSVYVYELRKQDINRKKEI